MPEKLRSKMISLAHEGHLGTVGTKQNLKSKLFWPGMDKQVKRFCKSCHGCQITSKGLRLNPSELLKYPQAHGVTLPLTSLARYRQGNPLWWLWTTKVGGIKLHL